MLLLLLLLPPPLLLLLLLLLPAATIACPLACALALRQPALLTREWETTDGIATPMNSCVADLDLSGLRIPEQISASHSGMRIVAVDEQRISHRWFAMDEVPEVVEPARAVHEWHSPPRECRL